MNTDAIARLRRSGEKLQSAVRDELLSLGPAVVPELVALIEDDDASLEDAPGDGWPPIHAVTLLADIRATEGVEPMLRALVRTDWMAILHDRILLRLPEFGAVVVEPALSLLEGERDRDARDALCCVLAKAGVHDDRIYRALCDAFEANDRFVAHLLADYGDPAARPLVLDAIDRFDGAPGDLAAATDLGTLVESAEMLGGPLPADLQAGVDRWFAEWEQMRKRVSSSPTARRKIGRNEPCPCGSGKKYKRCCIDAKDRAPSPGSVITRDGEQLLVSGNVDSGKLALARSLFAEKDTGRGPAQQMVDYAQPLLDSTDGSPEETQRMLNLAMTFWNAALMDADARDATLGELAHKYEGDLREEFWNTARMMIERHRAMFPEMRRHAV
jgi:hypothetical protein